MTNTFFASDDVTNGSSVHAELEEAETPSSELHPELVEQKRVDEPEPHVQDRFEHEEETPFEPDRYSRSSTSPPCGLRERSLLCPIQEEDTESTASGCSVSVNRSNGTAGSKEATPVSTSDEAGAQDRSVVIDEFIVSPKQEAEHDGNYFTKVRIKFHFHVHLYYLMIITQ